MTVMEALELYYNDNQYRLKSLKPNYSHFFYVCNYFKSQTIENFDINKIYNFIRYQKSVRQSKNRTINRYLSNLSAVFKHLKMKNIISENYINKEFYLKEYETEINIFTNEEYAKLILTKSPIQGIILAALTAGLRHSEILRLRWDNINMEEKIIKLFNDTKTFRGRVIPLSNFFYEWLENQPDKTGFVFPKWQNSNNRKTSFYYLIKKHLNASGVERKGRGLQSMRHTFATMLLKKGVDIRIVQELLGHKNIITTMRYTHIDTNMKKVAISVLNEGFYD